MVTGVIKPVNIVDELKSSYLDYAMSVIISRALPDVRDGLKPVQRRILCLLNGRLRLLTLRIDNKIYHDGC